MQPQDGTLSTGETGLRRPASGPLLAPGQMVAGRFRVLRFIAQGAMAEVYEAEDLELRERVAMKTIRAHYARSSEALERFRREIQLARKVTHPNVCRLFEFGVHHDHSPAEPATGTEDGLLFLTMELLQGETLAERLQRQGRLSEQEALPLAHQIAGALAAAHEAGVVHRDLKSSNVMMVPSKAGLRAVVTDFGLARSLDPPDANMAVLTGGGMFLGTPAYMAPEQVKGEVITASADIYAFGVVLYEMVTGCLPFSGATPLTLAVQRLKEAPTAPRIHVPALDPKWETAILRCLEREPTGRYESAQELIAALEDEPEVRQHEPLAAPKPAIPATGSPRRRWLAAAAAALVVGLVSVTAYRLGAFGGAGSRATPDRLGTSRDALRPRRSVAVLGFKNLSGRTDTAWLSTAFAEMLSAELGASEQLRIVPGENVARMKLELALTDSDSFAKDTLSQIHVNLDTDLVVLGSYLALGQQAGGKVRLDLRLQDTATGDGAITVTETATEAELFELISRTGERLREKLEVQGRSAAEADQVRAALPSSPEAARLYAEGLARLRVYDFVAARELLEKAVAAEPGFPLAHSALAETWTALMSERSAKEEAKKAWELSAGLPREQRLLVEGRYRQTAGERDAAVKIYRRLFGLFPDNVDHGLQLVEAQLAVRPLEAVPTLEELRKLPGAAGQDPRIDWMEGRAFHFISDYGRAIAAFAKAASKAKAQGAQLLFARARQWEGMGLQNLTRYQEALNALEEAKKIFAEVGDQGAVAGIDRRLFGVLSALGNRADAQRAIEQCVELYREIGSQSGMSDALDGMSTFLELQGDLAGARARREEGLAIAREIDDPFNIADHLQDLGQLHFLQGDLPGAQALLEESLELSRKIGAQALTAWALMWLGGHELQRGNFDEARRRLEASKSISDASGITGVSIGDECGLAEILLEEDQASEAEALLQSAAQRIQKGSQAGGATRVDQVLIQVLLAQGKTSEAQALLARVKARTEDGGPLPPHLRLAVVEGLVNAATGNPGDFAQNRLKLEQAIVDARRLGYVPLELRLRFSLGQLEIRQGNVADGRALLEALQRDALSKGFDLLARKAERAAQSAPSGRQAPR